jgi:hypothetical protein
MFPDFFAEKRNVVLMGCADGVCPWKQLGIGSSFVIVFINMNLPPDIRTKRDNIILAGITDVKPKNSQLVFELVVDDLEELWEGVPCWDASTDTQFRLRAMQMLCLYDYPGFADACLQTDEGSFNSCFKCDQQGFWIKALKKCKYGPHCHELGLAAEKHTSSIVPKSHDILIERANAMEVSTMDPHPRMIIFTKLIAPLSSITLYKLLGVVLVG